MRRQFGALVAVCLVVLSGCNAPLADGIVTPAPEGDDETRQWTTVPSTPEPRRDPANRTAYPNTPTPRPADVTVTEDLPVDEDRTFARVRQLLGTETEPPTVEVHTGSRTGGTFGQFQHDSFERVLGIGPPRPDADSDLQVGGLTTPSGRVYLVPRGGRPPEIERTLAHEFTHTVQFSQDARREVAAAVPYDRRATADAALAERSVLEGAAVYTSSEYVERYLPRYPTEEAQLERLYEGASAGTKLYWAAYHYGAEYVESQVNAPSQLPKLYRSPPTTTEQLLHDTSDEPVPLRVYAGDGDSPWDVADRDSRGELFVRIALGSEVPTGEARTAAAGWGNDEVLAFDGGPGTDYVWVTRWDDETNASEFATAADEFLDGHATVDGDHWDNDRATYDVERIDDRTVVVLAGSERFVSGTSVRSEADRVAVEPPDA